MNQYRSYFDRVKVSNTLHQRLLSGERAEKRRAPVLVRYGGMIACLALVCLVGFGVWRWSAPRMGGDITAGDSLIPGEKDTYGPGEEPPVLATLAPVPTEEPLPPQLAFIDRTNDPEPAMSIALPQGYFMLPLTEAGCMEVLGLEILPWELESYTVTGEILYDGEGQVWQVTVQAVSDEDADKTVTIRLAPGHLPPECVVYEGGESNEVDGVSIQADYFVFDRDGDSRDEYVSRTAFMAGDAGVRIEVIDHADTQALTEATTLAILRGEGVKLNELVPAEIPEWRSEKLTLAQAREEEGFGKYVPDGWLPEGFAFESAYRELGQNRDWLSASWYKGYDYIHVTVEQPFDEVEVMDVENRAYYDERLYTIPHCDSVPDEVMFGGFQDPLFRFEDLTLDVLEARLTYVTGDAGDTDSYRGNFSVLYPGGMVARYRLKGVTPLEAAKLLDIIK